MSEKTKLLKQINDLREKLSNIEYNEACEKNAGLYRKTFKYRNCYSCPENESDHWWVYTRVIHVDGHEVTVSRFQKDSLGTMTFESKDTSGRFGEYTEITEDEFQEAYRLFKSYLPEHL